MAVTKKEKVERNLRYQVTFKKKKNKAGLKRFETYIQPDRKHILKDFAKALRETPDPESMK